MRARRCSPRAWTSPFLDRGKGTSSLNWYLACIMRRCRRCVPAADWSSMRLLMVLVATRSSEMLNGWMMLETSACGFFFRASRAPSASAWSDTTFWIASLASLAFLSPTITMSSLVISKGPFCLPRPGNSAASAGCEATAPRTPESSSERRAVLTSAWGDTKSFGSATQAPTTRSSRGRAEPVRAILIGVPAGRDERGWRPN
mmetsp:Transcript_3239/g.8788  ORF Transcript_3239/g.8788 Transcript_3239/m.8788 type:complete len:202 (+) Transcript_3239:505-1110(+)